MYIVTAAIAAAVLFLSCNRREDPVVVIVTASAYTLQAGHKVEYRIWTRSVEGGVDKIAVTSFNEEQGRIQDAEIPVGKAEWKGSWVGDTPTIAIDTLVHKVTFTAVGSTGEEGEWNCKIVLFNPKEPEEAPE